MGVRGPGENVSGSIGSQATGGPRTGNESAHNDRPWESGRLAPAQERLQKVFESVFGTRYEDMTSAQKGSVDAVIARFLSGAKCAVLRVNSQSYCALFPHEDVVYGAHGNKSVRERGDSDSDEAGTKPPFAACGSDRYPSLVTFAKLAQGKNLDDLYENLTDQQKIIIRGSKPIGDKEKQLTDLVKAAHIDLDKFVKETDPFRSDEAVAKGKPNEDENTAPNATDGIPIHTVAREQQILTKILLREFEGLAESIVNDETVSQQIKEAVQSPDEVARTKAALLEKVRQRIEATVRQWSEQLLNKDDPAAEIVHLKDKASIYGLAWDDLNIALAEDLSLPGNFKREGAKEAIIKAIDPLMEKKFEDAVMPPKEELEAFIAQSKKHPNINVDEVVQWYQALKTDVDIEHLFTLVAKFGDVSIQDFVYLTQEFPGVSANKAIEFKDCFNEVSINDSFRILNDNVGANLNEGITSYSAVESFGKLLYPNVRVFDVRGLRRRLSEESTQDFFRALNEYPDVSNRAFFMLNIYTLKQRFSDSSIRELFGMLDEYPDVSVVEVCELKGSFGDESIRDLFGVLSEYPDVDLFDVIKLKDRFGDKSIHELFRMLSEMLTAPDGVPARGNK